MKRIVVLSFLFILLISKSNGQEKNSIGISAGILRLGGTAFGGSILYEKEIQQNIEFTFSIGAYSWNYGKDINTGSFFKTAETHIAEIMNWIIPARIGLKYNFGKSPSLPYASVEWGLNYIGEKLHSPIKLTPENPIHLIIYNTQERKVMLASLGLTMGYTINIQNNWDADIGIVTHTFRRMQYINFITSIKHSI